MFIDKVLSVKKGGQNAKIKNAKKRSFSLMIILAMLLTMIPAQAFAWGTQPDDSHGVDMEWYNLRNNQENNGVTESPTPIDDQTASLNGGSKVWHGMGSRSYAAADLKQQDIHRSGK